MTEHTYTYIIHTLIYGHNIITLEINNKKNFQLVHTLSVCVCARALREREIALILDYCFILLCQFIDFLCFLSTLLHKIVDIVFI